MRKGNRRMTHARKTYPRKTYPGVDEYGNGKTQKGQILEWTFSRTDASSNGRILKRKIYTYLKKNQAFFPVPSGEGGSPSEL